MSVYIQVGSPRLHAVRYGTMLVDSGGRLQADGMRWDRDAMSDRRQFMKIEHRKST